MRVLFLTHRLPYAPNRGDRIRSFHLLRALRASAEVDLFSLVDGAEKAHLAELPGWLSSVTVAEPPMLLNRARGLLQLAGHRPLTHMLLDAPAIERRLAALAAATRPDVVLAYCSGMARFTVDGPLQHLPCVIDMVDVDSEKWRALAGTARWPLRWIYGREARTLRRFEVRAVRHAKATTVVNEREGATLEAMAGEAVTVVENGVDIDFFRPATPPARPEAVVVFCGVMNYEPNVEGVTWFTNQVWPAIRKIRPDARFVIVGANPTRAVKMLAQVPGVEVTGAVADVRPYLWNATIGVAPLLIARGLQNKVLEALAAGLPVVTTPAVAAGLPAVALEGCRVAGDPAGFAEAVAALLATPAQGRDQLAASADLSQLSWSSRMARLIPTLEAAARG